MTGIVQIAGVAGMDEARMLVECGVDRIGIPLRLDVHEPDLSETAAAGIIGSLPPPARAVVITYLNNARDISALCRELGVDHVQLHGELAPGELTVLKKLSPGLSVLKSIVIRDRDSAKYIEMVRTYDAGVDEFITDTFDSTTGASGATGKTHDWAISRAIVEASRRPVILAGGLTPRNVHGAILAARPQGVDVHTGVEDARGKKNRGLVQAFVAEARQAFAALDGV